MKKKLSLFMAVILLFCSIFNFCGCKKNSDSKNENSISQGEWLAMLNEKFGMYTYNSSVPYYDEVDITNKYFGAVQIAYEWDIIDDDTDLKVDEPVNKQFAANTLVRAVGYKKTDGMSEDQITELAAEEGYIDFDYRGRTDNKRTITTEDAEKSLEAAKKIWTSPDFGAPEDNSVYQDSVVDLTKEDLTGYYEQENKVYIPKSVLTEEKIEQMESIKSGSLYILPPENNVSTEAVYKAESVEKTEDYIVINNSIEEIQEEEIYEDLEASGSVAPDLTAYPIIDGIGNTLVSASTVEQTNAFYQNSDIQTLKKSGQSSNVELLEGGNAFINLNFKVDGLKIAGKVSSDDIEFSVEGEIESDDKVGKIQVSKSYNISDISFDYNYSCKFPNIKDSAVFAQLNYKTKDTSKIKFELSKTAVAAPEYTNGNGKFPSNFKRAIMKDSNAKGAKSVKIVTIPILVSGGIRVDLDVKIKISVSGQISLVVTTNNVKGIEYKNGNLRYINDSTSDTDLSLKAKAELTMYLGVSLKALKNIVVASFGFEGGIGASIGTTVHLTDQENHLIDEISFDSANADTVLDQVAVLNGVSYTHDMYGQITVRCESCVDTSVYGILKFKMDGSCLLGKIFDKLNIKFEFEFLNEENAKIEAFSGHYENWVKVDKCTRKYNMDEKKEEENTEYETHIIRDERLDIDVYYMSIFINESEKLNISEIPQGYSISDLIWESADNNIATVTGQGVVTGVSFGTTIITVKTSDGKYKSQCTISIGGQNYT
ncbi:MAG: Ig-like domain-containing protein [Lachnospiraceae bacterium]